MLITRKSAHFDDKRVSSETVRTGYYFLIFIVILNGNVKIFSGYDLQRSLIIFYMYRASLSWNYFRRYGTRRVRRMRFKIGIFCCIRGSKCHVTVVFSRGNTFERTVSRIFRRFSDPRAASRNSLDQIFRISCFIKISDFKQVKLNFMNKEIGGRF